MIFSLPSSVSSFRKIKSGGWLQQDSEASIAREIERNHWKIDNVEHNVIELEKLIGRW
jgi:hypothetical protein